MKNIVILMFALLIFCMPVEAKIVRFIQVTDVHFSKDNTCHLDEFVQKINKYKNLDFVVFTGDNIDKPRTDDLKLFLSEVKKINKPVYILIGNHDVFKQSLDKKTYMKTVQKELGIYHSDKPNYMFKKGGIVFIVMDGAKEVIPGAGGYFKEDELNWLKKVLSKNKTKKVVILQHFPFLNTTSKGHQIYKGEEYFDILKQYDNIIAVVSGHYHTNQEEFRNGIYNVVTQNFSNGQYCKLIEIDDNMIYTRLIDEKE